MKAYPNADTLERGSERLGGQTRAAGTSNTELKQPLGVSTAVEPLPHRRNGN